MQLDLGLHAVERPDVTRGQDIRRRSGGQHQSVFQEHQRPAQAGREVEVVRRDDNGDRRAALEVTQERRDLELIGQVERRRRLVEQQDSGDCGVRQ